MSDFDPLRTLRFADALLTISKRSILIVGKWKRFHRGGKDSVSQPLWNALRFMSKHNLPPCSVRDCERAAGAIISGALLCGEHAVAELKRRRLLSRGNCEDKSPER